MTQVVDDRVQARVEVPETRVPRAKLVVLSILAGVVAGVALIALLDRPDSSSFLTAESYAQYAEAMKGIPPIRPAEALTAESYRQYAEAMKGIAPTRPADSAETLTAESYRRYAEAMKGIAPPGN